MIDDKDSVQLSEYCFDVCRELKTVIRGRNVDSLDESVRAALQDLGRCVDRYHSVCPLANQLQGHRRNRADSKEGGEYAAHQTYQRQGRGAQGQDPGDTR